MAREKVKVTETERKYELAVADLVPDTGDEAPTWCNLVAGLLDKFRVIPRLIMVAYIYAFYQIYFSVWAFNLTKIKIININPMPGHIFS